MNNFGVRQVLIEGATQAVGVRGEGGDGGGG